MNRPGQFTSKNDAMNRRKLTWACQQCRKWYSSNPKKQACVACGCKSFFYFPSKAEAKRFSQLCLMMDHNLITNLELQVNYPVVINGVKAFTYRADFRYTNSEGVEVVEDVKPKNFSTDVFKLKKKVIEAIYPIKIQEVTP